MSLIRTLPVSPVSPFLIPEPQDSSVQLPHGFMLQKVGCFFTKEKTAIFCQQPQMLELLILLRLQQHSSENTMLLFLFPFSPLS